MEAIDQCYEFLNYENVCQAEKEILQNIVRGTDSKEYSRGLFSFTTPFSDENLFDYGQGERQVLSLDVVVEGEGEEGSESCASSSATEVSVQHNGPILALSTIPTHVTMVSQGPPGTTYYPGQAHLPVAVSATSAPISSVGPSPMSNPPTGNPMIMFAPGMPPMIPQQTYYPPPYYGPQGNLPTSYVPIDNTAGNEGYSNHTPQGPPHHKHHHHESHHNSGSQSSSYKGRRKQPPPPVSQQQQQYFYSPYYPVPYYNQQQLQNVTGHPIIMGPGMYIPHPAMYSQGPPGSELEQMGSPQMMHHAVPNEAFMHQSLPPTSQAYNHSSSPSHNNHRTFNTHATNNKVSGGGFMHRLSPDNTQAEPSTKENIPSENKNSEELATAAAGAGTVTDSPKSLPALHSNGTTVSTSSPSPPSPEKVNQVNNVLPICKSEAPVVKAAVVSNSEENCKSDTKANKKGCNAPVGSTTDLKKKKSAQSNQPIKPVVPIKEVNMNGDISPNLSDTMPVKIRDNSSADIVIPSSVDDVVPQNSTLVTKPSSDTSVKCNNISKSNEAVTLAHIETRIETMSISEAKSKNPSESSASSSSLSSAAVLDDSVPQPQSDNNKLANTNSVVNRSWASIASAKNLAIPNCDGATSKTTILTDTSELHNRISDHNNCSLSASNEKMDANFYTEFDPLAYRLGEHISKYSLDHQPIPLVPRGLYNHSNSCYINSILQALLACPPFVNIFRSFSPLLDRIPCKAAPVTQNLFEFVREFTPLVRMAAVNKKEKEKARDNCVPGPNLEASGIRKSVALLSKDTFKVEGRQEDAEEFLSFLLNSLNDEMVKVAKMCENKKDKSNEVNEKSALFNGEGDEDFGDDDDDQWQVMGARNKGCLTRRTAVTKSPISEAFLGQMCSTLSPVNASKKNHLEPFFTFQLAIQNDNIKSVKDALEAISLKEEVSVSVNGNQVEAWRQISFEELPPVLVLHLKRFVFEKNGIHKVSKKVEYTVELEIGKELISANSKMKYSLRQRQYKLFAVVYHDGDEAHKGHYVVDCFHPSGGSMWGQWAWLRYDDTSVKQISEANMLNPSPPRVPYLLFYRRQDTISLMPPPPSKKGS